MTYSVVVPTLWKSNLEKFYDTLQNFCEDDRVKEIILIDNDITFEHPIKSKILSLSKLKYYPQEENIYVNPSWNLGVRKSIGVYIIHMNDDFYITSNHNITSLITSHHHHINKVVSIYGISTSCYIEEPTSPEIIITDNEGRGTGWGCFFIIARDKWVSIPHELKIWFGDDYITKYVIRNGGKVYTFKNIKASPFSQTVSLQTFNPIMENDRIIYMDKYDN
jgi:acetyltransferase-like isoleucine patch superfamily enzyme